MAFSAAKRVLERRLSVFDKDIKVEDVVGSPLPCERSQTFDIFFLHTLLEVCCSFIEPDPLRRKLLFSVLEKYLVREKLVSPNVRFEGLVDIRRKSAKKFIISLNNLRSSLIPSPTDSISPPALLDVEPSKKYPNAYEQNFVELKVIAKGGFGVVCMARHKVDGIVYAVKKITFTCRREKDFTKVICEVKSISTLSHKHIVSYKNCWIQLPNDMEKTEAMEDDSESHSSAVQRPLGMRQRNTKPKCATILDFSLRKSSPPWNDAVPDLVSTSDFNTSYSASDDTATSKDNTSESTEDETVSESESSRSLMSSDTASKDNSVLSNGNFNLNVAVSLRKALFTNSWSSRSALDQASTWSENDESIIFQSTGDDSVKSDSLLDHSFGYKFKFTATLCIQMEYCNCDLRLWLDQRASDDVLPFQKEIKDVFRDILKGVTYIHSKSIIHRDLKPKNIFYSEKDDSMKIGDFGLATLGHSSPNRHRVINANFTSELGTYPYAAPEQLGRNDYDNKVDVYSLGIILIELLLPFKTRSEFYHRIPDIVKGEMPEELISQWPYYVDLVKNLVQRNPRLRMSAKDILDLPLMEEDALVVKRLLQSEIEDLKKALEEKDRKYEDALNKKNAIIKDLNLEINKLSDVVKNLRSKKKSHKKH